MEFLLQRSNVPEVINHRDSDVNRAASDNVKTAKRNVENEVKPVTCFS